MDFYEYDSRIIETFTRLGFELTAFHDRNYRTIISRAIERVSDNYCLSKIKNYEYQMCFLKNTLSQIDFFDVVFIIVGRYLDYRFLRELKRKYKSAQFILYLWDDLERVQNFEFNKMYFNTVFSIEKADCKKYGFNFQPLFYTYDYVYADEKKDIMLYGAGIDHSQRIEMIETMLKTSDKYQNSMVFYIYSSYYMQIKRILKNWKWAMSLSYIHYNRLSLKMNAEYTKKALCLIDIQYNSQNGLSLRTIESLAAKTKLLTTNVSVREYDFYTPENIMIIPRDKINKAPIDFILAPHKEMPQTIVDNYSLENWCKKLLL